MYYSTIGVLAILILSIDNYDILLKCGSSLKIQARKVYREFLFAVLGYYITDVLWGILESQKMAKLLFIDTLLYFIAMAVGILLWTRYAVTYLDEKNVYGKILVYIGRIFYIVVSICVAVNIFYPIIFSVDSDSIYRAGVLRDMLLITQIILLILVSIYAFSSMVRRNDITKKRYRTIGMFGLIMAVFLFIQLWFPYLPLYSVAYMLGTCLLHTFVVNDEKEEYKYELEEAFKREKHYYEELKSTRALAYTDALTGVQSKLAYVETEEKMDIDIREGNVSAFAIAVFDLNDLKEINDQKGHEKGDQYIISACLFICNHFKDSPVFRVGGDEFAVLLEGQNYKNRYDLKHKFNLIMDSSDTENGVIIAMGMADYMADRDSNFYEVFERADKEMYRRKQEMKNRRK